VGSSNHGFFSLPFPTHSFPKQKKLLKFQKRKKRKKIENFWGYSKATNLTTLAKLRGG
jgi:hypothetical protein